MTKPDKTLAQQSMIALRRELGHITQEELAFRMGKSLRTVARWESARPPSGESLRELLKFAVDHGCREVAGIFEQMIEEGDGFRTGPWTAEEIKATEGLLKLIRNRHNLRVAASLSEILGRIEEAQNLISENDEHRHKASNAMAKQATENGTYDDF